jgi:hypothetical protein
MAFVSPSPTQITPPRVSLVDPRSGAINREWYRFFLSLLTATQNNQDTADLAANANSLLASYDAVFGAEIQALESAPSPATESDFGVIETQLQDLALSPPTRNGIAPTMEGGTGQTSYSDGQLLIGSTANDTLVKATLTPGVNIGITNAAGAITIDVTGGVSGTFVTANVPPKTVTVTNGIITSIV